ncbi:MAG: hypothetical protein IPI59_09935 [Sphingobacteriales bacterium]|jgi:hypothetical protein|nr:hypothetical protein [Sphingobacteriales bacterium]MBP9142270.1 hypothetical protein [Chitinophagales bacterium]MDA0199804.1 hypothetical protein [Bacteroidota bacterium]MBK6889637.1 hypothetical protein [Sphingobacteriales bacterium]MBK7527850.1 hypothetical protein [Sphingobacteriales bacterium]
MDFFEALGIILAVILLLYLTITTYLQNKRLPSWLDAEQMTGKEKTIADILAEYKPTKISPPTENAPVIINAATTPIPAPTPVTQVTPTTANENSNLAATQIQIQTQTQPEEAPTTANTINQTTANTTVNPVKAILTKPKWQFNAVDAVIYTEILQRKYD